MQEKQGFRVDKKITNGLILLMICFVAFRMIGYLNVPLKIAYINSSIADFNFWKIVIGLVDFLSLYGFNIVVGAFLSNLADKIGFQKLLWFFAGAIFGFSALILFFVLEIRANYFMNQKED